jgi:RNA polymerase sigma-70 factor, ECF subfamily
MTYLDPSQSQAPSPDPVSQAAVLAEKARDGDKYAFERLVGLFQEEIYRMVFYRTQSRMDAEDLTQDIFLLAFRNLSRLKDLDRFRPWIFKIAVNRVRDFHRKKRFLAFFGFSAEESDEQPEQADIEAHGNPRVLDELMKHEFWGRVENLSKRFSPMEREVFALRFMDELGIREIAEVLNKSESAVKTHLYRALKKFKDDATFNDFLEEGTS